MCISNEINEIEIVADNLSIRIHLVWANERNNNNIRIMANIMENKRFEKVFNDN